MFAAAACSLFLLWIAFPPVGLSWLAWIAPVPLIWLVQVKSLPARRPYRQLFVAGLLYWLATFYFIPIPHPGLWLGWFTISAYMALYTPMFVGVTRTLILRFRLPTPLAVPIVWTGIEWIRCNFATGMAMACLSHTQYKQPKLIQVADLSGAYTLTFVMTLFAAVIATDTFHQFIRAFSRSDLRSSKNNWSLSIVSFVVAVLVLVGVWAYGNFRLEQPVEFRSQATLKVGLIQTSEDVLFGPISVEQQLKQIENKYQLTWQARKQWGDLDLVVWPESGFNPYNDLLSDADQDATVEVIADLRTKVWREAIGYPDLFDQPVPLLTGGGTMDPEHDQYFNAAFLIGKDGQISQRYFKNHLVMFGEYVPFAGWFPIIDQISPIRSLTSGTRFESISVGGVNIAPSICFETTIPHLIRRQINTLTESGNEPDVMVNVTNDGWFFGTSCLDLHLACNVFRAVEMRKPHLVCANTGFSAEIDTVGRLLHRGQRRGPDVLRADVRPIVRSSLYRRFGDVVPMMFGIASLLAGLFGWYRKN